MVDEIVRHDPAAAWERLESPSRLLFSAGTSLKMSRECKTREIGKYGAHGPALSVGTLSRGMQNVVRNFERCAHNLTLTHQTSDAFRNRSPFRQPVKQTPPATF
jgi:hypothetical protein